MESNALFAFLHLCSGGGGDELSFPPSPACTAYMIDWLPQIGRANFSSSVLDSARVWMTPMVMMEAAVLAVLMATTSLEGRLHPE